LWVKISWRILVNILPTRIRSGFFDVLRCLALKRISGITSRLAKATIVKPSEITFRFEKRPGVRATADSSSRRGTNFSMTADFNQAVVLDSIRRSKAGASRVELGHVTGLSTQTVSNICRRLLDLKLIEETGKSFDGPGKPRIILSLNESGHYSVGVHIDPSIITIVILGFSGKVVARKVFATPAVTSPKAVVAKIGSEILKLILKSGVDSNRILGLGIASPGPIDQGLGVVVDPPNLLGWHRVPLRDELAMATGLSVILDKDVTAAAVGEIWNGKHLPDEDFVFFYTGIGLGAGLVLGGDVFRGFSGNAGEVGGIVGDHRQSKFDRSKMGSLAELAQPLAMILEAESLGVLKENRVGADPHSVDSKFTELSSLANSGDQLAREILIRSAVRIGSAASSIMNLLDITTLVLGGPFWARLEKTYLAVLPDFLEEGRAVKGKRSIRVLPSSGGVDVAAVGAGCLVLDQAFSPRPGNLIFSAPAS
jgi:predicted NBD/HSP70 family sugar kinase